MSRIYRFAVLFLIVSVTVMTGCSFGDDTDKLKKDFYAHHTDTSSGVMSSDSSTDTESASNFDSDSVGDTTSASDNDTDTGTITIDTQDTGIPTDSVPTDSMSDTIDTVQDTATVVDTDSSTTTVDIDTGTGSDTGPGCADLLWECGIDTNTAGVELDCNIDIGGCAATGEWCENHLCTACNTDDHCGVNCVACGGAEPKCIDGQCVECGQDTDCPDNEPICNTNNNTCVECLVDSHCRPDVIVVAVADTDTPADTGDSSSGTDSDTVSDTVDTTSATVDTAVDTDTSFDTDTMYVVDTGKPFLSPLGVCTPDNTCSCWVGTPTAQDTDVSEVLRRDCDVDTDCPDNSYRCLRDYWLDDGVHDPIFHKSCLRVCNSDWTGQVYNGLECRQFDSIFVWVPMTTCYAFNQLNADCSSDTYMCSVDGNDMNGTGDILDGACNSDVCTYRCADSNWCAEDAECGTSFPFEGSCVK